STETVSPGTASPASPDSTVSSSVPETVSGTDSEVTSEPSSDTGTENTIGTVSETNSPLPEEPSPSPESTAGSRDNTPRCLTPTADGTAETHNDISSIDYSNAAEGYIMARYLGTAAKVKMQIKGPDAVTYTYNLVSDDYEAFPLSGGNGAYEITILENLSGTSYLVCLAADVSVSLSNEFGPYLYPNQYCKFDSNNKTVAKAVELAEPANSDLDVVANVYNYIIENITYDYDKAATVPSGYTSNVDEILKSGTGICLDYAAVMTSMLRSQRIPTRLEVGYVGDAYHAWISTYITDIGWVNGIVKFDGQNWELMDPTLAANSSEAELKSFIGDGSNYIVKYMY
ncbi:MAG: transglutaminase family protein, partial [Lachnospiraceae bacterium]